MLLSEPDQKMFAKYYGHRSLLADDGFWDDVLKVYMNINIPMPWALTEGSIKRFTNYLVCPPGECGECCNKPWFTPVTQADLERMGHNDPQALQTAIEHLVVGKTGIMNIQGPCPFLRDNFCSIYSYRPDCCRSFPIQTEIHAKVNLDGQEVEQMWVRVKCKPGVNVVRGMFREMMAKESRLLLLPNLNIVMENS